MPLRTNPVPMPDKKVTYKTINGTVYVYHTLRSYRNENGKPTSDEVSIGKKDKTTGLLIPNRRYFELYQSSETPASEVPLQNTGTPPTRVTSYGNGYTLTEVSRRIGLREILEHCFPQNWRQILAAAFYILCEGNVMMYIDDWFDETDVPFAERMDDYQCSRLFAAISYRERMRFFKRWVGHRAEQEYIAYDVTSVSTYSLGIDIAEWGYNRDGEKLPQVNIGMFYGAESRLPVYYDMYNGSIADKSHLKFMMEGAGKLGVSSVRFVLDGGFMTEDNLKYMEREGNFFITAFPGHLTEAKKIIDRCKDIIRKSTNRISAFDVYAFPVDTDMYGFPIRGHVYYDPQKQALDEKELFAHIEKLKENLEKMNKSNVATKKYTDFFKVGKKKMEKISFEPDNEKIDERLSRTGFFILLSNDFNMGSHDALRIYRGKDAIEENFDQMKNSLDFRRLRTHLNKTTDGKVFVGFLALILRSYLLRKVKDSPDTKHLTLNKALKELRKIRVVTFEDESRSLMPVTKLQRTILEAFDISHELMEESVT